MFKSLKNLLGLSLLAFFGVWMGCSSDSSPVSPSNKAVTDDGTATQVSTFTVSPDSTEVVFTDVQLHHAVRRKVKPDAPIVATITRADMLRLTALDASNKGITDLTGLEHATNLDTLILWGNKITNVDSLAGLTGLEVLKLKRNNITNVAPLAGLRDLVSLDLENNLIPQTGYSPLANLTKLTSLRIGGHRNANIGSAGLEAVVANMGDLEDLKVNNMGLTDIAFLEKLTKLRIVNLNSNYDITDFKPLVCLPNLSILRAQNIRAVYELPAGHNRDVQVDAGHDPFIQYLLDSDITITVTPYFNPHPSSE